MKMKASSCYVCGRNYEPDEEYLQVETVTSKPIAPQTPWNRTLVAIESNEDTRLLYPYEYQSSAWMRTSWVCLKCVAALPVEWQQIFSRPSIDEWVPVEKLGKNTFAVRRRDS